MTPFNEELKRFARSVLRGWPDSFPDEFELFDLAVEHDLLIGTQKTAPCEAGPESCNCYADNGPGPATCYSLHPALAASD